MDFNDGLISTQEKANELGITIVKMRERIKNKTIIPDKTVSFKGKTYRWKPATPIAPQIRTEIGVVACFSDIVCNCEKCKHVSGDVCKKVKNPMQTWAGGKKCEIYERTQETIYSGQQQTITGCFI